MAFYAQSLMGLLSPILFAVSADVQAQIDTGCSGAAPLWIPIEGSTENTVVKWSGSIKYEIASIDNGPEASAPIEMVLRYFAAESGLMLKLERQADLDLSIVTAPDISAAAAVPAVRNFVEGFFQDLAVKKGMRGRFEIDPVAWEAQYQNSIPKCGGLSVVTKGVVERAFILIQQNEPRCASRWGSVSCLG